MAMTGSTFNPYQSPDVTSVDAVLAPDTEFLFNDKVVAGVGRIVLPRICVVTGMTDRLVAHESRLWWCSRWITNGSVITALAAAFVGIPMLTHLPPGATRLAPWPGIESFLQLMVGAALCVAAVGFLAAGFLFRSAVDVRWFISDKIANTSFNRRLWNLSLASGVTILCWILAGSRWRGATLMATLWTFASVVALVRGKRRLFVAGTFDGLFLIGGLSDAFLAETQRLVAACSARGK
jgi:hypothetical protein